MTISLWRYSHLALAISSFLLLILASVTGIILSFDPIAQKSQAFEVDNFSKITLGQSLPVLRKNFPDITELSVDANQFVRVRGTDKNGETLDAYVDPLSAEIIGKPVPQSGFFQWVTAFHRSLFIHETGRFFVGLSAFLLLLIAITGSILILKRQRGIKRFFTRIVKDSFAQYYHVVLGRLSLVPIILIALSGTYLSLVRFELIDVEKIQTDVDFESIRISPQLNPSDFVVFKNTKLSEVESIEFPFSEDPEDYYILKLADRELAVNQITGDILDEVKYPRAVLLSNLSLDLHTGRTSIIWALVLAISSANILFFIYSGFAITLRRRSGLIKNNYSANDCRIAILVGSENGSTYRFAKAIQQELIKQGEKSYLTEINNYTAFPRAEHLILLSATYGRGEAPTNAEKFAKRLQQHTQVNRIKFSVLGFGSYAYPDYCKFAFEAHKMLSEEKWATALTDMHTVNDRSPEDFKLWAEAWSQQSGIPLSTFPEIYDEVEEPKLLFRVLSITPNIEPDASFLIRLQSEKKVSVQSGDLLAIYPQNDHRERLYSIGIINNEIQLSIRLHPGGLGSGYLSNLRAGETVLARLKDNKRFHFPDNSPEVLLISNGTGIAPFLGMVSENKKKVSCHLYAGFRTLESFVSYESLLQENVSAKQLTSYKIAYSREGNKQYVSELIASDAEIVSRVLATGGTIMICGSLVMERDVMRVIEAICAEKTAEELSFYQSHNQILTDCY